MYLISNTDFFIVYLKKNHVIFIGQFSSIHVLDA